MRRKVSFGTVWNSPATLSSRLALVMAGNATSDQAAHGTGRSGTLYRPCGTKLSAVGNFLVACMETLTEQGGDSAPRTITAEGAGR